MLKKILHVLVGVLGTYSFSPNGDGRHSACVVEVKKGQPVLKKVVTVE